MIRTGDRVRLTCEGRTVDATVLLASSNGRSLMVGFEAILAGHVGMMPLLSDDDPPTERYRSVIGAVQVIVNEL